MFYMKCYVKKLKLQNNFTKKLNKTIEKNVVCLVKFITQLPVCFLFNNGKL